MGNKRQAATKDTRHTNLAVSVNRRATNSVSIRKRNNPPTAEPLEAVKFTANIVRAGVFLAEYAKLLNGEQGFKLTAYTRHKAQEVERLKEYLYKVVQDG